MGIRKRIGTCVLALGLMMGSTLTVAAPAQAWPLSSTVTVTGKACFGPGANPASGSAVLNGQTRTIQKSGSTGNYTITFDNVPSGAGGWAWFWSRCTTTNNPGGLGT